MKYNYTKPYGNLRSCKVFIFSLAHRELSGGDKSRIHNTKLPQQPPSCSSQRSRDIRGCWSGCELVMGVIEVMGDTVAIGDAGCITSCVGGWGWGVEAEEGRAPVRWGRSREGEEREAEREEGSKQGTSHRASSSGRPNSNDPPKDRLRAAAPCPAARSDGQPGGRRDTGCVSMQPPPQRQTFFWAELCCCCHWITVALAVSKEASACQPPHMHLANCQETELFLPRWAALCIVFTVNWWGSGAPHPHSLVILTCRVETKPLKAEPRRKV